MQDNIKRFRALLERYHDKDLNATDEQIMIMYEFVYENKFYPLREKMAVRESIINTVLYLKRMANQGHDSLDKIDHYFKKQKTRMVNRFRNLRNNND